MSLPLQAVDRLFERLSATYGRQFFSLYEGMDPAKIKTVWAHELSGFGDNLHALAWALENLPERAPNVIEFRNLARRAPIKEAARLPEPPANPARLRAELAKLMPDAVKAAQTPVDGLAWARRIVARHVACDRVPPAVYRLAKDAIERRGTVDAC